MYLELVFRHMVRDDVDFRCLGFADSFSKDVIFDIEEILAVFDVQGDIVVIAGIGAHGTQKQLSNSWLQPMRTNLTRSRTRL